MRPHLGSQTLQVGQFLTDVVADGVRITHLGSQTLQVGQFLTEVEADGVCVLTWAHKPFRWVSS